MHFLLSEMNRNMVPGKDDESLKSECDDHSFDSSIESQKGTLKSESSSIIFAEDDDVVSWGSVPLFTDSLSDAGVTLKDMPRHPSSQNPVHRNDNIREVDRSPSCSSRVFMSPKRSSAILESSHQDHLGTVHRPFGDNWLFSRHTATKQYHPTKGDIGISNLPSAPQTATSTTKATTIHDVPSVVQIDTRGLLNVEELSPTCSNKTMMTTQTSTVLEWDSLKRNSPSLLRERDTNRLANLGSIPPDVQCDSRGLPLESPLTCSGRHITPRRNFVAFGTHPHEESRRLSTEAIHTRSNFMIRSPSRSSSGF